VTQVVLELLHGDPQESAQLVEAVLSLAQELDDALASRARRTDPVARLVGFHPGGSGAKRDLPRKLDVPPRSPTNSEGSLRMTATASGRRPLGLVTDLYQLTMASAYWKAGGHGREVVFELFFRQAPFGGGFAIASGLSSAVELLERFGFDPTDLDYLEGLRGADSRPLFEERFLEVLAQLRFSGHLDAIPEGTVVFGHEPLLRIEAPILECQLLETGLLNALNFQTLIATKASRVRLAAGTDVLLEFGLRRAQGLDGGLTASRAAYVGGCDATSNVLAGKRFGIPVQGTHAHSLVMFFEDEPAAFEAFAQAQPANCVLLVDTYDSLGGVRHAIEAGRSLRERGFDLRGIRLDSGDLTSLARAARRMLDEAGFREAAIVASGDLDEHAIAELKAVGAPIRVWGVGTRLATAYDEPALGGVYKLVGLRREDGSLAPRMKLSDDPAKATLPGAHQVRRYRQEERFVADVIYALERPPTPGSAWLDLSDPSRRRRLDASLAYEDLLRPIFREGKRIGELPSPQQARERTLDQLGHLPEGAKHLRNPEPYPVGIDADLHALRERLAGEVRKRREAKA
jgi:nicotinate phosphoribosyltransferase